ncbi:hypothetical protein N9937_00715 [bacterium]|nr:hypothetical protein [bacterium]
MSKPEQRHLDAAKELLVAWGGYDEGPTGELEDPDGGTIKESFIAHIAQALAAAEQRGRDGSGTCEWAYDDDDFWNTSCDRAITFIVGGVTDNDYQHCPGCGKKILQQQPQEATPEKGRGE